MLLFAAGAGGRRHRRIHPRGGAQAVHRLQGCARQSDPARGDGPRCGKRAISRAGPGPGPTSTARYPQVLHRRVQIDRDEAACAACRVTGWSWAYVLFQHHCNDCHAVSTGLFGRGRAHARLDAGHDPDRGRSIQKRRSSLCRRGPATPQEVELLPSTSATIQSRLSVQASRLANRQGDNDGHLEHLDWPDQPAWGILRRSGSSSSSRCWASACTWCR